MKKFIGAFLSFAVTWPVSGQEVAKRIETTIEQVQVTGGKLVPPPNDPAYRIVRFLELRDQDEQFVMVGGGRKNGIVEGAVFKSYRRAPAPTGKTGETIWVETGTLKSIQVAMDYTIAKILSEATLESKAFFAKHPGIMAGDWVMEHQVSLTASQVITPTATIEYQELFEDPKAYPVTFELTEEGKKHLAEVAEPFTRAKLPQLMVEAYTDGSGASDANQIESYQRALAIKQFLVNELGFDPARIVAIGYGESDPVGRPNIPGNERLNRRIVLKVRNTPVE